MTAEIKFIGHIQTPYQSVEECPHNIQENGPECILCIDKSYHNALLGLQVDQPILIMYWLDGANRELLQQNQQNAQNITGTFALRSPHRPNPIGVAIVDIKQIQAGQLTVNGLDCLNGTKLIDIKPAIKREKQG